MGKGVRTMWGACSNEVPSTRRRAAVCGNQEEANPCRALSGRPRKAVSYLLGLILIALAVGACGGDSLDLDLDLDLSGEGRDDFYDARYEGAGTMALSSDLFEVVCSEPIEAKLGFYESNDLGRLSLTYLRPDVERAERTEEERAAGVERSWVCAGSKSLREFSDDFTTTGVDGRFVFNLDDEFMGRYGGELEVVVTSSGAALTDQMTQGPKIYDVSVESMDLVE